MTAIDETRSLLREVAFIHRWRYSFFGLVLLCFSAGASARTEVDLVAEGGVYKVPVRINEVITLNFIIDSGASTVQIPADVALTLLRAGTISSSDFLPGKRFRLADGSTVTSEMFRIRQLSIGGFQIDNVEASLASVEGPLLLGQSLLSRFPSWTLDNQRHVLILGDNASRTTITAPDTSGSPARADGVSASGPMPPDAGAGILRARVHSPNDGFLALRSNPSSRSGSRLRKVPHGTPLSLEECIYTSPGNRWCKTAFADMQGWAYAQYLIIESDPIANAGNLVASGADRTANVHTPSDGFLALRSEPNTRSGTLLKRIPHGTMLMLDECVAVSARSRWCKTSYGGQVGWVSARFLIGH